MSSDPKTLIAEALARAVDQVAPGHPPVTIVLERPKQAEHGDFSSNVALQLAKKIGRSAPTGEVDRSRLNVNGGSIALGHPFAATGARIVTQALNELKRRNKNTVMCTVCAAGGLGAAVVLER